MFTSHPLHPLLRLFKDGGGEGISGEEGWTEGQRGRGGQSTWTLGKQALVRTLGFSFERGTHQRTVSREVK